MAVPGMAAMTMRMPVIRVAVIRVAAPARPIVIVSAADTRLLRYLLRTL